MALSAFLKQPFYQRFFGQLTLGGGDDDAHLEQTLSILPRYSSPDCLAIHSFFPWGRPRNLYNTKGAAYLLQLFEQYPERYGPLGPPLRARISETLRPRPLSPGDLFDVLQTLPLFPTEAEAWIPQLEKDLQRDDLRLFEQLTLANFMHQYRPELCEAIYQKFSTFKLKQLLENNAFKQVMTTHELGYTLLELNQVPNKSAAFNKSLFTTYERIHHSFVLKKFLPATFRGRAKEISLGGNLLIAIAMMEAAQQTNEIRFANTAFYLIDQVKFFQNSHHGMLPTYFPSHKFHTPLQYPIWLPCYMVWALEAKRDCLQWLKSERWRQS